MKEKTIVIGAGFGGLASAALLAKKGHDVVLLEKNSQPGGRARRLEQDGFTFDMGPSWYLMPSIFDEYFSHFDAKPGDYYTLERLDPGYKMFFHDGEVSMPADKDEIYKLFDSLEENGAQKLKNYLKDAEYKYKTSIDSVLYESYDSILDMFSWKLLKKGIGLDIFSSMDRHVSKHFSSDRAKKVLQYTQVFLGGAPNNTPAVYSLMSYVDLVQGVWYPRGGMYSVVKALEKLCEENGVSIRYDTPARGIRITEGVPTGVDTDYGVMTAQNIVVNADYHHAETKLLPKRYQTYPASWWKKKTMAPSAFLIYLGLDEEVPELEHHSLFLQKDWTNHFEDIFDEPSWPKEPSYYVCCPSKTDDEVAPEGKENLFILVPIPSGIEDTTAIRKYYRDKILSHMAGELDYPVRKHIETEKVFTLKDFNKDYNAYKGTALGLAHTVFQSAAFRPKQKSSKVKNLYYVGQYTHPGIGVPMTLISAENVVNIIE